MMREAAMEFEKASTSNMDTEYVPQNESSFRSIQTSHINNNNNEQGYIYVNFNLKHFKPHKFFFSGFIL